MPQGWQQEVRGYARKVGPTVAIFVSVGLLVAAWAASGVIALLIVRGLDLISPQYFLASAAAVTAVVAFATGTSWGAVSTIGVALMGVASGLGAPPAAAAGAVVAGAHFGDKLSPLSETATLAATVAGTDLYTHIRHTAWTTVPAFLAAMGVYLAVGAANAATPDLGAALVLKAGLARHFALSPLLWAPVALVTAAALLRWPVVPSLLGSAALAAALAVALQAFPPQELPALFWRGYRPTTGDPVLDDLLAKGGVWVMVRVALLAVALFALVVAALRTRPGRRLLAALGAAAHSRGRAVLLAVLLSLSLMAVSGASYLAILVTGELMRDSFRRLNLAGQNLSRTLEDSGTVVAPLVPWGASGHFMAATLGVSAWQYGPYAVVNYLGFALAILYGYTGWFIRPAGPGPGARRG